MCSKSEAACGLARVGGPGYCPASLECAGQGRSRTHSAGAGQAQSGRAVCAQGFQATDVVAGAGEVLPDGGRVWRMRVRSPGAESLLLLFRCGPGSAAPKQVGVKDGAWGCCTCSQRSARKQPGCKPTSALCGVHASAHKLCCGARCHALCWPQVYSARWRLPPTPMGRPSIEGCMQR